MDDSLYNGRRLNLPPADLRLRRDGGVLKVFDVLRRKYVTLTPEEYVRQHFVNYLTQTLGYPPSLCANESVVELNGTRRRPDTIVYGSDLRPFAIVEYKAPEVEITQEVFDQIARYNMVLRVRYLIVSNGMRHYCCVMDYDSMAYHFIPRIPDYAELTAGAPLN